MNERDRKQQLLDRYQAHQLETTLEELRYQAVQEKEKGRFPWHNQFLSGEEIRSLQKSRERQGRWITLDLILAIGILAALAWWAPDLVRILSPA